MSPLLEETQVTTEFNTVSKMAIYPSKAAIHAQRTQIQQDRKRDREFCLNRGIIYQRPKVPLPRAVTFIYNIDSYSLTLVFDYEVTNDAGNIVS